MVGRDRFFPCFSEVSRADGRRNNSRLSSDYLEVNSKRVSRDTVQSLAPGESGGLLGGVQRQAGRSKVAGGDLEVLNIETLEIYGSRERAAEEKKVFQRLFSEKDIFTADPNFPSLSLSLSLLKLLI